MICARPCRRHRRAGGRRAAATAAAAPRECSLFVALAALLPVGLAMLTRPAMYNGVRHFVFVLPPLAVLGGLAGGWLFAQRARDRPCALRAARVDFAVGVALPVSRHGAAASLSNTPPSIASPAACARRTTRYMLDYWGLAFKQAGEALRAKLAATHREAAARAALEDRGLRPASAGAKSRSGPTSRPTWDRKGADFAMMLGTFYCRDLKAPVLAEIMRDGVGFARVYDIRGRPVPNLLTEPPP